MRRFILALLAVLPLFAYAQDDAPLRVGGDVLAPKLVKSVEPVYTEIARRARIQGVVIVEAVITRKGRVTQVRVLKSLPMGLDKSAIDAVQQYQYEPATLKGREVAVYYNITVRFTLPAPKKK